MKFLNFIATLLPSFKKSQLLESCELTRTSIGEHTLPAYQAAAELMKGNKFKSKTVLNFQTNYARKVSSKPMIEDIAKALENSLAILIFVGENSKKIYAENETNISLTYVKTTLMRVIQASEFANTYARRLLNYIYICEAAERLEDKSEAQLSPAEIEWLVEGFDDFCISINLLKLDTKVIQKHIDGLPDAMVTDLTEKTFISTIGEGKLDPFQLRHLSTAVNPFYLLGLWFARNDAIRYKAAKEELELLQLRKLQLEKLYANTQDAKLEKEIDYMQNRVSNLIFKIEKLEKDYHV